MAKDCKIGWIEALARQRGVNARSWNPVIGCSRASSGCQNCYAAGIAHRFGHHGAGVYAGLTERDGDGTPRFNGKISFCEKRLVEPLSWRKPAVVFAGDMADLFHPNVTDEMLDKIFAVMALRPDCLFLVLTKRPERMREYCSSRDGMGNAQICHAVNAIPAQLGNRHGALEMPMPNVWLGVTAENQAAADDRIPHLLATPAAKRFVSVEPMLGPADFDEIPPRALFGPLTPYCRKHHRDADCACPDRKPSLDWVICGGESGSNARPMHPDWARGLRDQCAAAAVPFFFKQWGEWAPIRTAQPDDLFDARKELIVRPDGGTSSGLSQYGDDAFVMRRVGKKAAGRLLDGREWNETPIRLVTTPDHGPKRTTCR